MGHTTKTLDCSIAGVSNTQPADIYLKRPGPVRHCYLVHLHYFLASIVVIDALFRNAKNCWIPVTDMTGFRILFVRHPTHAATLCWNTTMERENNHFQNRCPDCHSVWTSASIRFWNIDAKPPRRCLLSNGNVRADFVPPTLLHLLLLFFFFVTVLVLSAAEVSLRSLPYSSNNAEYITRATRVLIIACVDVINMLILSSSGFPRANNETVHKKRWAAS